MQRLSYGFATKDKLDEEARMQRRQLAAMLSRAACDMARDMAGGEMAVGAVMDKPQAMEAF